MGAFRAIDERGPQLMRWLVSETTSDERPGSGSLEGMHGQGHPARTGQPSCDHSHFVADLIGSRGAMATQIRRLGLWPEGIGPIAVNRICTPSIAALKAIIVAVLHSPSASLAQPLTSLRQGTH